MNSLNKDNKEIDKHNPVSKNNLPLTQIASRPRALLHKVLNGTVKVIFNLKEFIFNLYVLDLSLIAFYEVLNGNSLTIMLMKPSERSEVETSFLIS